MKRYVLLLMIVLTALSVGARDNRALTADMVSYPGGKCMMYRVYLKDKAPGNTPFSLSEPQRFLSARALARRERQGIRVDDSDLPVAPAYLKAVQDAGIEVVGMSKWNNTLLVRVQKEKEMKKIKELAFVLDTKKVFTSPDSITDRKRSNFRKEFNQWEENDKSEYGTSKAQVSAMNGELLHQNGFRGRGMMIAVFDGGFMNVDKIPALHHIKLAGVRDFVVPRSKDVFKEMEHGTMVLSTMAVNSPHYYIGVAPEAEYLLVRCEDERTESLAEEDYWAEAAEYADSCGVDVINSSLGYHDFDDASTNHVYHEQDGETALISRTASMCASKGIVCVNSAGNDGMGSWKRINFPADAKDILTVGSVNEQGRNAPFSAVGPTADGRVKPDVMAYGSPTSVVTGRGAIINDNGTSFSAPLIAGMVACLWQALPGKTAQQIMELVRQSGNNRLHPDNVYGYGVPDFWKAYQAGKK